MTVFYQLVDFFLFQSFLLHQSFSNHMQLVDIVGQQLFGSSIGIFHKGAYLFINFGCHFFTVILVAGNVAAQEYLILTMTKGYRTDVFAHAVFANHLACQLSCTLQVIAGTAGNFLQHQSFGNTAAQQHLQLIEHFAAGCIILIFLRQAQGITTGTATRNDGNLMYRIGVLKQHANDSMTAFMVSSQAFFLIADDTALALRSHDNTLGSLFHFRHIDSLLVLTGSQQRCFINQIG